MRGKWGDSRTGRLTEIMRKLIEEHGVSYVGAAYGQACAKYPAPMSPPRKSKAKAKANGRLQPPHLEGRTAP
jgi:hypothetical protein